MNSTNVTSEDDALNVVRNYSTRNPWHSYPTRANNMRKIPASVEETSSLASNAISNLTLSTTSIPSSANTTTDATFPFTEDETFTWESIDYLRIILVILIMFFLLSIATLVILHIRQGKFRESRRSPTPIMELKYERMHMQIEMYPITPAPVPPVITFY